MRMAFPWQSATAKFLAAGFAAHVRVKRPSHAMFGLNSCERVAQKHINLIPKEFIECAFFLSPP
jgi:hypothetical protein